MPPTSLWLRVRPLVSAFILLTAVFMGLHLWSGVDTTHDSQPPAGPEAVPNVQPTALTTLRPPVSTPRLAQPMLTITPTVTPTWVVLQSLPLVPVELTPTPTATPTTAKSKN